MKEAVKKKEKLNNAGFSLVEILISLAILAVIVVPIVNNFMSAANVNQKAKNIQKATTVAQNIMEGLKTVDTENTSRQFNGDPANPFSILNSGSYTYADKYEIDEVTKNRLETNQYGIGPYASTTYTDVLDESTYKFAQNVSSKYVYAIDGIGDGINTYDALVKIDANVFTGANSFKMPNLIDLDSATTVVLDPSGTAELAINELLNRNIVYKNLYGDASTKLFTKSELENATTMTMTLDIKKVILPGDPVKYVATGKINYRVDSGDYLASDREVTMTVYSQEFSKLESMYIMYIPFSTTSYDKISINYNSCDLPNRLDIFIVEQLVTGTSIGRVKYNVSGVGAGADSKVKLYSNVTSSNILNEASEVLINSGNDIVLQNDSAANRLYNVQVEIYSTATATRGKYSQKLATLSSAREE